MSRLRYAKGLIGGGANDLDFLSLHTNGDFAFVMIPDSNDVYFYQYDSTDTKAENSPNVIVPDNVTRPAAGSWILMNPAVSVSEITGDTTLTVFDFGIGRTYSNQGAVATVTLTLPSIADMITAGKVGSSALFYVMETQLFECDPNASDGIRWEDLVNSDGEKIYSSVIGSLWTLMCTDDFWLVTNFQGAVYFE